ncbi:hypothetical protein PUN28_007435 [Cardiocondyla obscurior]|uniref:Uncharacterized protein n=1 Tax=Cardiocondyla obscurior TaxID=286306 RepID=A0AAW2G5C9_9HYME
MIRLRSCNGLRTYERTNEKTRGSSIDAFRVFRKLQLHNLIRFLPSCVREVISIYSQGARTAYNVAECIYASFFVIADFGVIRDASLGKSERCTKIYRGASPGI